MSASYTLEPVLPTKRQPALPVVSTTTLALHSCDVTFLLTCKTSTHFAFQLHHEPLTWRLVINLSRAYVFITYLVQEHELLASDLSRI